MKKSILLGIVLLHASLCASQPVTKDQIKKILGKVAYSDTVDQQTNKLIHDADYYALKDGWTYTSKVLEPGQIILVYTPMKNSNFGKLIFGVVVAFKSLKNQAGTSVPIVEIKFDDQKTFTVSPDKVYINKEQNPDKLWKMSQALGKNQSEPSASSAPSTSSRASSCSSRQKALDNKVWQKVLTYNEGFVAALSKDKRMLVVGKYNDLIDILTANDKGVWSKKSIDLGNARNQGDLVVFDAIALSVDKRMIVAGSASIGGLNGLVRVWTADDSGVWSKKPLILDDNLSVSSLELSVDKRMIVAVGKDDTFLRVWTADNRGIWSKYPSIWKSPTGSTIHSVALSVDGLTVVAGCADGSIVVWAKDPVLADTLDVRTVLDKPKNLERESNPYSAIQGPDRRHAGIGINSVALSVDNRMIVAGLSNGFIKIFTANDQGVWSDESRILWTPVNIRQAKDFSINKSISSVALADNNMVVAGSEDGSVKIWALNDQCEWVSSFLVKAPDELIGESFVDLSPDGSMILVKEGSLKMTIWALVDKKVDDKVNGIKK